MVRKAGQVFRPRLLSLAFAAMERLRIMPQVVIAATAVAMAATFWNGALGADPAPKVKVELLPLARYPFATPYWQQRISILPAYAAITQESVVAPGGQWVYVIAEPKGLRPTRRWFVFLRKCYLASAQSRDFAEIPAENGYFICQVAVSPKADKVVTQSISDDDNPFQRLKDTRLYYQDCQNGEFIDCQGHVAAVGRGTDKAQLRIAPSSRSLICDTREGILIYDMSGFRYDWSGFQIEAEIRIPHEASVWDASVLSDNCRFAAIESILPAKAHHKDAVNSTGGNERPTIQLIELSTGQICRQFLNKGSNRLALSSNGGLLAAFLRESQVIDVWDTLEERQIARIEGFSKLVVQTLPFKRQIVYDCRFLPNSNILVVTDCTGRTMFFAIPSGRQLAAMEAKGVDFVMFAPEGREMVAVAGDAIGAWHIDRNWLRGRKEAEQAKDRMGHALAPEAAAKLYDVLGSSDARTAYDAMSQLCNSPREAVNFFEKKLRPTRVKSTEIARWISQLNSDDSSRREAAYNALEKSAQAARKQLQDESDSTEFDDVRLKLQRIMDDSREYSLRDADSIRELRAIYCLEKIATDSSFAVLERLSHGPPDSVITENAADALARLRQWVRAD